MGDTSGLDGILVMVRADANLRRAVHAFEAEYIRRILEETGGNRKVTARRLGINVSTLYRKMAGLGIGDLREDPGLENNSEVTGFPAPTLVDDGAVDCARKG